MTSSQILFVGPGSSNLDVLPSDIGHEVFKNSRSIDALISSINQNELALDCQFVNLMGEGVGSPKTLAKKISKSLEKFNQTIIYYLGVAEHTDSGVRLLLPNSSWKRSSWFSLSSLPTSSIDRLIFINESEALEGNTVLGAYENKYPNVLFLNRKGNNNESHQPGSLASSVFKLMHVVPKFSVLDAVRFHLGEHNVARLAGHKLLKSASRFFVSSTLNTEIWNKDTEHFESKNRGSREDGLHSLRYLSSDLATRQEARDLLRFFQFADASADVRSAASRLLSSNDPRDASTLRYNAGRKPEDATSFLDLIQIPAGKHFIGSRIDIDKYSIGEEQPLHELYTEDFQVSRDPVSVDHWKRYLNDTARLQVLEEGTHSNSMPITYVSWYEAVGYCVWLTSLARLQGVISLDEEIRLPTEVEWEKAARGTDLRMYPWGDDAPAGRCNFRDELHDRPVPFRRYGEAGKSPYGVQNMSGNVWEWTISNWGEHGSRPDFAYPYDPADGREDLQAPKRIRRVIRGGAFYYFDYCLRCSTRNQMFPETRHSGGGFRIVVAKGDYLTRAFE